MLFNLNLNEIILKRKLNNKLKENEDQKLDYHSFFMVMQRHWRVLQLNFDQLNGLNLIQPFLTKKTKNESTLPTLSLDFLLTDDASSILTIWFFEFVLYFCPEMTLVQFLVLDFFKNQRIGVNCHFIVL